MMQHDWPFLLLVGFIIAAVWAGLGWFSREARLERRRRKSHSRVVSKSDRPMVRFSVKPPKEK
jgi:hypothetical protein